MYLDFPDKSGLDLRPIEPKANIGGRGLFSVRVASMAFPIQTGRRSDPGATSGSMGLAFLVAFLCGAIAGGAGVYALMPKEHEIKAKIAAELLDGMGKAVQRIAKASPDDSPATPKTLTPPAPATKGIRRGELVVALDGVFVAPPIELGFDGKSTRRDAPAVVVRVRLLNVSKTRRVDSLDWSDATLADELGNVERAIAPAIAWHGDKIVETVDPGEQVVATVCFRRPVAAAKRLILSLPGSAVDSPDPLRFVLEVAEWQRPPPDDYGSEF